MQTGAAVCKIVLAHVLVGPFEFFRLLLALAVHVNELFHHLVPGRAWLLVSYMPLANYSSGVLRRHIVGADRPNASLTN